MDEAQRYVEIMIESLRKKEQILDFLIKKNEEQAKCITESDDGEINWTAFNLLVTEKQISIENLNKLDEGFSTLYERLRDALMKNSSQYQEEIKTMQQLIKAITEKSVVITTGEERNRTNIERALMKEKQGIKRARMGVQAANQYYKNMSGSGAGVEYGTLDQKK